ncbi:MAG TPA: hypothetical protein VFA34_01805 [Actinomycetota bacterium]|jgi:hypothetical protein|nr:hypothetical protein [Actinomycetota bacterium]
MWISIAGVAVLYLVLGFVLQGGGGKDARPEQTLIPGGILERYIGGGDKETISGRDGFRLSFPVQPDRSVSGSGSNSAVGYTASTEQTQFSVAVSAYKGKQVEGEALQSELRNIMGLFARQARGELLSTRFVNVDGLTAIEFEIRLEGGYSNGRALVNGRRFILYQVVSPSRLSPAFRTFVNSFELVDS